MIKIYKLGPAEHQLRSAIPARYAALDEGGRYNFGFTWPRALAALRDMPYCVRRAARAGSGSIARWLLANAIEGNARPHAIQTSAGLVLCTDKPEDHTNFVASESYVAPIPTMDEEPTPLPRKQHYCKGLHFPVPPYVPGVLRMGEGAAHCRWHNAETRRLQDLVLANFKLRTREWPWCCGLPCRVKRYRTHVIVECAACAI